MAVVQSKGYRLGSEPRGLAVKLYDFQKSTYQWMLDQEDTDLNGYFWEEWRCPAGTEGPSLYYFPLAGEFRLTKPPKRTGGLLCEEMGLGKVRESAQVARVAYVEVYVADVFCVYPSCSGRRWRSSA